VRRQPFRSFGIAMRPKKWMRQLIITLRLTEIRSEDILLIVCWKSLTSLNVFRLYSFICLCVCLFISYSDLLVLYLLTVGVEVSCCIWSHAVTQIYTHMHTHTHTHTILRTPLDKGSTRRRDLWQHTTLNNRHTSIRRAGFEPAIPENGRSQTQTL